MTREDEIEAEVQARVAFKMNELLTGVKNTAKANWHASFSQNSQKYFHYSEALKQFAGMVKKEIEMGTPYAKMSYEEKINKEKKDRKLRDEAVESIISAFNIRGTKDHRRFEEVLVRVIKRVQR